MLYFDFDTHNNTKNKILASSTLSLSKNITETNFNRIALSKLSIDFNDSFFCHVPLQEGQEVKTAGPFQQLFGYFQSIYNIYWITNISGTVKSGVFPIYYKSVEKTNYSDIPYNVIGHVLGVEYRTYDNFNSYFEVKNYNSFLKSVNECIKYALCDSNYGNLGSTYEPICPTFYTASNVLHSINLSNYQEDAVYKQVSTPAECQTTQNTFCIGISKTLGENIYHPFLYTTINNELHMMDEDFTFLNLDVLISKLDFILIPNDKQTGKKYYITDYQNTDFYEYMNDIQEVLIHTNMPVATLYKTSKKPSFVLTSNEIDNDIAPDILLRLVIEHDRERLSKISYSNPSITNNFSQAYSGIGSSTYFKVYVSMVDKFNNIYPLYLKPNASMYVQMALFNKDK